MLLRASTLLGFLLAVSTAVHAQEDTAQTQQARGLFEAGRAAFEAANYEAALRHFREAYELSRRYQLLYNIGVSADRLRRDAEALEAFERFLSEAPQDAAQRPDAEVRVRVLREAVARGTAAPPAGDTSSDPSAPRSSSPGGEAVEATAGLALLIGGAAVLAGGVVFLAIGQAEASSVESVPEGTPWPEVEGAADRANWMRITGWILGGVGLAAAAAGLTLMLTAPSPTESVALHVRPNGVALAWRAQ